MFQINPHRKEILRNLSSVAADSNVIMAELEHGVLLGCGLCEMAAQFGIGLDNSLTLKVMTKRCSPTTELAFILAIFFPNPLDTAG